MRFLRKKTNNAIFESAKPGTNPSAVLFDGSATGAKKAKNIFKRKSIPGMRMEKTNPQLREIKLKKKKGAILVSSDRPTSTVLHEYYHNVNGKTIPNYENYENSPIISPVYKSVMRGVGEAAEENLASSRVLRTMKNNITPLERESMNRALNSYVGNGRLDTLRERAIQRSKVFKSFSGKTINADVNGSYNILRKCKPSAFDAKGVQGVVVHPHILCFA